MPIFRLPGGLGFFADVPRTGGDRIAAYLAARFGPLAFRDDRHTSISERRRWSRSSPQHIDAQTLGRLFPPGFFVASFAVVRHPAARLAEVYAFQQEVERLIPRSTSFGEWLEDLAERLEDEPYLYDNSVRPMADLVPEEAEVFHFEDGAAPIVAWLDRQAGTTAPELELDLGSAAAPDVTPFDRERIAEIHAADYRRFGYGLRPEDGRTDDTAPRLGRLAQVLRGRTDRRDA